VFVSNAVNCTSFAAKTPLCCDDTRKFSTKNTTAVGQKEKPKKVAGQQALSKTTNISATFSVAASEKMS
jgi:hypothetical protein